LRDSLICNPQVHVVIGLLGVRWQPGVRSGPEDLRLGRRELVVGQRARGVQLGEVFEFVGRVRRRRRILRLLLVVAGAWSS
jgi:hypothetical protein